MSTREGMSSDDRNELPDSAFAFPDQGRARTR
jgi:hypothetical protein